MKRLRTILIVVMIFLTTGRAPRSYANTSYEEAALAANLKDAEQIWHHPVVRHKAKQLIGIIDKTHDMTSRENLEACCKISLEVLATYEDIPWVIEHKLRQIIHRASRLR